MLSLPWVIERPGMVTVPDVRWFAIDCPPVGIRRVWALTGALDGSGSRWDVHLVLPRPAARLVMEAAEVEVADDVTPSHCLVTLPATPRLWQPQELQQLLRVAYNAALS